MKKIILSSVLCMIYTINAYSQNVCNISTHNIYSAAFRQNRSFRVWLPEKYDAELKYGVIYVLDANYLFEPIVSNVSFYSAFYYK